MSLECQINFRLDQWLVDPLKGSVSHQNGKSTHLEPKVMEVLVCLARHANQLVTRSDLLDAVWDGNEASDELLTRAVSEIRRSMNLQNGSPCHIQTVPKRGYCLIAEVSYQADEVENHSARSERQPSETRITIPAVFALGGVAIVLIFLLIDSITFQTSKSVASDERSQTLVDEMGNQQIASPRPTAITNTEGFEYQPALSPDGSFVAFVSRAVTHPMAQTELVVQQVRGGTPVQLTNTDEHEFSPTWSADGTQIAFIRADKSQVEHVYDIVTIPALGGVESNLVYAGVNAVGLDWSPDGAILAFGSRRTLVEPFRISLFSFHDGEIIDFTPTNSPGHEWRPRFSPDGMSIAFLRRTLTGNQICQRRLYAESHKCITPDDEGWSIWDFDWTPDGQSLVIAIGARSGGRWLAQMPADGGDVVPLSFGEQAKYIDIAMASNRLAYSSEFRDQNIWLAPGPNAVQRASVTKLAGGSMSDDIWPVFSPDGEKIAFVSARTSFKEIWVASRDGSKPRQLTQMGDAYWPRWSPDSQWIVFSSRGYPGITRSLEQMHFRPGQMESYIVNASAGPANRLLADVSGVRHPSFSEDGAWLYYEVPIRGACGRSIWKTLRNTGAKTQLTDCGFRPLQGRDGRVYFMRGVDQTIHSMAPDGNDIRIVLSTREKGCVTPMWAWDVWEDNIVYLDCMDLRLKVVNLMSRQTRTLAAPFTLASSPGGDLSVSADGKWIAFSKVDRAGSDLYLVDRL